MAAALIGTAAVLPVPAHAGYVPLEQRGVVWVICNGEPIVFRLAQFAFVPVEHSARVPAGAPPAELNAVTLMPAAAALTVMV